MRNFVTPNVVVSKCLGFAECRWNGQTIPDHFVDQLEPHVHFRPVCPEVEIGLGAPRDPIRIVSVDGEPHLLQPETERDVSEEMRSFTHEFLDSLEDIDGFLLKNRSPSCGLNDVRIYSNPKPGAAASRGQGFFGGAVMERYPQLAIEDEGRLKNFRIREHFYTRLFTFAEFRTVRESGRMKDLVQFHAENKYLLMAYDEARLRRLGRIVANPGGASFEEVIDDYEGDFYAAFSGMPPCGSHVNVLQHAMGYFSDRLDPDEKAFFLEALERYQDGKVPLSTNINLMRSWIARFDNDYLASQTFFEPYPEELVEITDSGKEMACVNGG